MKKKNYIAGVVICSVLLAVSGYQVFHHYVEEKKHTAEFDNMVKIVEETEKDTSESDMETDIKDPLLQYQKLFDKNNDMVGWIAIDGTNIQYPVMYTPDRPDFYLKRSFEKEYSSYGVPYIAEHCNPNEPSDNLVIYGHHMNNGTMFSDLMKYTDKKFYENHKKIQFDTLTEHAEYEVVAVFKTTVYDNKGFKYYEFASAETPGDFEAYVSECRALSLYDTGVTAVYGDKLITLSTCEYSAKNGRLVVVAKKIIEQ